MKPRVMSLVVFTALVGLAVAPGHVHPLIGFTALLCIAVGAGAAGALNMWYDADIDARHDAHRAPADPDRPRAAGRGAGLRADAGRLCGGGARACWSTCLPRRCSPSPSSSTSSIYTMWLKRSTPQNIVIGGAAGAFPPMIGWAAATGSLSLEPVAAVPDHLLLDAAAFLGAGALPRARTTRAPAFRCCRSSPARADTRRQILLYTLILVPLGVVALAARLCRRCSMALTAIVDRRDDAGAGLAGVRASAARPSAPASSLFAFSILYLFLLFAVLLVEQRLGRPDRPVAGVSWTIAMDKKRRTTASCSPRRRSARGARARSPSRWRSARWSSCSTSITLVKGPVVLVRPI